MLYTYRFLDDFVLLYPVYTLLFSGAGLSVWQISSLFAIWSVSSIAFEVPSGSGTLTLTYPRSTSDLIWYLVVALGWIVVIGGAFARHRPQQRAGRAV